MKPGIATLMLTLLLLLMPGCSKPAEQAAKSKDVADAKEFQATQDIVQLRRECLQFRAVHGELPESWDELGRTKDDPWGNEYALVLEETRLDVYSAGPDGEYDTPDDIRAPE
jgi:hypothetical protein